MRAPGEAQAGETRWPGTRQKMGRKGPLRGARGSPNGPVVPCVRSQMKMPAAERSTRPEEQGPSKLGSQISILGTRPGGRSDGGGNREASQGLLVRSPVGKNEAL